MRLRARVAANVAAAVSITSGLFAVAALVVLRGAMVEQLRSDAARSAEALAAAVGACGSDACATAVTAQAERAGLSVRLVDGPGCAPCTWVGTSDGIEGRRIFVERAAGGRVLRAGFALGPLQDRLRSAATRLLGLLVLNGLALVAVAVLLLERSVLRRLGGVGEALERVERLDLDTPLLVPDATDEVGRVAATVRRMTDKLRDERTRREAYIAELERTNRALRETREGLERSERLATVGRLAAGVAHEIGNPVAAVLGYLDVLKLRRDGTVPPEYLERIGRETRRIDRIVRDLLEFSRPRPLTVEPVSLAAVVENAAGLVLPQPRWRRMRLVREVPERLPAVDAQLHFATQVLVNLLINAADACGGEGEVRVSARVEGDEVVLEVRDDGPGIAPADLARIFDPFFTTKDPGEGTGLGLALSLRIMEQFGGGIAAGNVAPHGAAFTLRFRSAGATPPAPGAA